MSCFVSDGAAINRRFYSDHHYKHIDGEVCIKDGVVHKARNMFELDKYSFIRCEY